MDRVLPSSLFSGPTFEPHSPQALAISQLFTSALVVCGVVLVIVVGLIAFCMRRFRAGAKRGATQTEGNRWLEISWTLGTLVILAWLLVLTSRAMSVADPPIDREPDLTVIAHQWWWEVRYASGAITANEIHLPVGKSLVLRIESADVVHDFWVPSLGRKIDAIPGRVANIWLQADEPGIYLGTCAEFCGAQHAWMRIRVIAQSPAQFAVWAKHQSEPADVPAQDAAREGAELFRSKTCVSCHAIRGTDEARTGPDLTHLTERTTLGAGVLSNTPEELARWLKEPQQIKPGCHMPNAQLSAHEVAQLVAYFETLR